MAKAGLWTCSVKLFAPPELLFGRTQRLTNHRFHYYTSTRAIEDFLRILESLPSINGKSQIQLFSRAKSNLGIS